MMEHDKADNIHIIDGDILKTKAEYIAHQCNCITDRAGGLAYTLFIKYPFANDYREEVKRDPGRINIHVSSVFPHAIINMFAQYYPGSSGRNDSKTSRLAWFQSCLDEIATYCPSDAKIAMPWKIGCGLAGGNWDKYYALIEKFARDNPKMTVFLHRLE